MNNVALLTSAALLASLAGAANANIVITEAHSSGSGNTTYQADWFELTNTGTSAVDITGWTVDDSSNGTVRLALRGVTTINPGQSVVFIETNTSGSNDAAVTAAFVNAWFGGLPTGFVIGTYGGSGIGLSTGGDAINIFEASSGPRVTGIAFGTATTGVTFDNYTAQAGSTTLPLPLVSTLSVVGVNNAFTSLTGNEVGSPGNIPTPGALALVGLAGLAAARRRR